MKFFAILKDSLREAIDAKVFYVMVGLSILLIGLAATTQFSPQPGGKFVMELACLPISIDLSDLDSEEMQRGGDPGRFLRRLRGSFQVTSVTPIGEEPELPTSRFRIILEERGRLPFFFARAKPEQILQQIEERFGHWDGLRVAEILALRHVEGHYEIDAQLTPLGRRLWPHDFSLFFGALPIIREGVPLGVQLYALENVLVNQIGAWITILISVVITAFFIPNMLRKGTVDMLIIKPIHRTTLLLYKYLGGLLFIFLNTTIIVVGVWLALSLRSGVWAWGFLVCIPVITFFFAILYAVSTLFGVLTRSPIVAILMTCGIWFVLFIVGTVNLLFESYQKVEEGKIRRNVAQIAATTLAGRGGVGAGVPLGGAALLLEQARRLQPYERTDSMFATVVRRVHYILPRTSDLNVLITSQLQRDLLVLPRGIGAQAMTGEKVTWGESLTVSGLFIALMLGVACWWFSTRDY